MSLILNIDTATERASVSLSVDGTLLQFRTNAQAMDHAAWIHPAINEMLQSGHPSYNMADIAAIAVVAGPGSYTGLRVGMATAKGFCYALNVPLICLNTLSIMAYAAKKEASSSVLLCPMLDARRMEVFTALYDASLQELISPGAMVLDQNSFADALDKQPVLFFGSGSLKWKNITTHKNAVFKELFYSPQDMAVLAEDACNHAAFSSLAYTEPVYLKPFYSPLKT
jgi:tRNA threonylcarbamoyladenosine biosynthesis protein TsaB